MFFPSILKEKDNNEFDLQKQLIPHPSATYLMKATDDGMVNASIPRNALLVVDRSVPPSHNKIVICNIDGQRKVRRLVKAPRAWILHAENPIYKPVAIAADMEVQFFGVVTSVIITF